MAALAECDKAYLDFGKTKILRKDKKMKAMVLKEFCEIKVKDEPQKRIDLPLKEDPLEMPLTFCPWLLKLE